MGIVSRNLDDRNFDQLVSQAKSRLQATCPGWTDWSAGDPGRVLVELFAYLTDTLIYRLNRLPDKAYVEFLRLLGVRVYPPMAALVELRFSRKTSQAAPAPEAPQAPAALPEPGAVVGPPAEATPDSAPSADSHLPSPPPERPPVRTDDNKPITINKGTRVGVASSSEKDSPVFVTLDDVTLQSGQASVDIHAIHAEWVVAELLGTSNGKAGQSFKLRRAPVVAAVGNGAKLDICVEIPERENQGVPTHDVQKKKWFRIWREVENFVNVGVDRFVYVVDRMMGTITFAPTVTAYDQNQAAQPQKLGEIPPAGREIRAWYHRGGGSAGNVQPGTLTVLKDPIPGLEVTNLAAAAGGRDAESLENALRRAPQAFHSLERAVTARDFESFAIAQGGVSRAQVFAQNEFWTYASPGTVQVLLVPTVPRSGDGPVTLPLLQQYQTKDVRDTIEMTLLSLAPLGTAVSVDWISYRSIRVEASVVAFRGENADEIRRRIEARLNALISPIATPPALEWGFEQPLRIGRVYDALYGVPGVKDVDEVVVYIDEAPSEQINSLAADWFQPATWYAGSGDKLYRSMDDGHAWTRLSGLGTAAGETVTQVQAHRGKPGYVAVVTARGNPPSAWRIWLSTDCGASWRMAKDLGFSVKDVSWINRENYAALLIATAKGLFELAQDDTLQELDVGGLQKAGFWAIAVTADVRGRPTQVAVASGVNDEANRGVWISPLSGVSGSYKKINLPADDIRVLRFQHDGARAYLWAGQEVVGGAFTKGPYRWAGPDEPAKQFPGWQAGSCYGIAVSGLKVFVATLDQGVMWLDTFDPNPAWKIPDRDSGLPRAAGGANQFARVRAMTTAPTGNVVLAGGDQGVFRSEDAGIRYANVSTTRTTGNVLLPRNSLFVSAAHQIKVSIEGDNTTRTAPNRGTGTP